MNASPEEIEAIWLVAEQRGYRRGEELPPAEAEAILGEIRERMAAIEREALRGLSAALSEKRREPRRHQRLFFLAVAAVMLAGLLFVLIAKLARS